MDNKVIPLIILSSVLLIGFLSMGSGDTPMTEQIEFENNTELSVISVIDQPVAAGKITIEKIETNARGWIVIHADNSGEIGDVIGFRPIIPGIVDDLEIGIDVTKATVILYASLYPDHGTSGLFDQSDRANAITLADGVLSKEFRVTLPFGN